MFIQHVKVNFASDDPFNTWYLTIFFCQSDILVDEEIPPHNVERFECLEKNRKALYKCNDFIIYFTIVKKVLQIIKNTNKKPENGAGHTASYKK